MREWRRTKIREGNYFAVVLLLQVVHEGFFLLVTVLKTGGLEAGPLEIWCAEDFCVWLMRRQLFFKS